MSKESIDLADSIIMDAYKNGLSIISTEDNKVVKHRLNLFGEWIDGAYYLNDRGFDYASSGCRAGIKAKQVKDEYVIDLGIEATKKAMNDADRAFLQSEKAIAQADKALSHSNTNNHISLWALGIAILALVCQALQPILERVVLKWLE